MLAESERDGLSHIVSWCGDGKSFKIHKPKLFMEKVLRKYFPGQTRIKSFQRQLKLYSFQRIKNGSGSSSDKKGSWYFHPQFERKNKRSCLSISRMKVHNNPSLPVLDQIEQGKQDSRPHIIDGLAAQVARTANGGYMIHADLANGGQGSFDQQAKQQQINHSGNAFGGTIFHNADMLLEGILNQRRLTATTATTTAGGDNHHHLVLLEETGITAADLEPIPLAPDFQHGPPPVFSPDMMTFVKSIICSGQTR
jgi:hypothetical protein